MNNEIGRKITSLTLMTIMVAGGMTFAAPGFMPAAYAANANLFVSAENSQFDNYMSGPQVIEVVVIDSDINDTDDSKGEPDVTVNGKILRMVQGTDGNWYGYFADKLQAETADATATPTVPTEGLDFGVFCDRNVSIQDADAGLAAVTFGDTSGVAFPFLDTEGGATNNTVPADGTCGAAIVDGDVTNTPNNVVRESKTPSFNTAANVGQIGIAEEAWPFIQLYTLNPTGNVIVQYNKGGGAQTTTLTFDTVEGFAGIELDRTVYPQGAEIHVTITDLWLNIDPTDEDSWTFGTLSGSLSTNYQVFDENGNAVGDTTTNTGTASGSLTDKLGALMCEDNCILIVNPDAQGTGTNVLTLQDNDDSAITATTGGSLEQVPTDWETSGNNLSGDIPVTITELGPTSGVFGTYDESDVSSTIITSDALRGTSATIDYNETPTTILVGFDYASIDIQPIDEEWSSGEEIPVVLVDGDANLNSRADEDLDLFNPAVKLIPALSTGSPFTLTSDDTFFYLEDIDTGEADNNAALDIAENLGGGTSAAPTTPVAVDVQAFSQRALINSDGVANVDLDSTGGANDGSATLGSGLIVNFAGRTLADLKAVVLNSNEADDTTQDFFGFNFFNYDIRTFNENQIADGHAVLETDIYLIVADTAITAILMGDDNTQYCLVNLTNNADLQGLVQIDVNVLDALYDAQASGSNTCANAAADYDDTENIGLLFFLDDTDTDIAIALGTGQQPIVADFFSFGFIDDGVSSSERVANQIIRIELEETGDNTSTFEGSLEYIMVNQLNINVAGTYSGLSTIADDPGFIVIEDLTDEDSPRVNYNDRAADGTILPVADQEEAPSHSGVVSFDLDSYKIADTVVVTLEDADLNVDSDLIDIFTVVTADGDIAGDNIGATGLPFEVPNGTDFSFGPLGVLLNITYDDELWLLSTQNNSDNVNCISDTPFGDDGLGATGFTLIETGIASGVFVGDFAIPNEYCARSGQSAGDTGVAKTVTGTDLEVNYIDFRDASGEIIEVGDSAGVRAHTGSISLDRTVYPVPWGVLADFGGDTNSSTPNNLSVFPIHLTGIDDNVNTGIETLGGGDLTIHVRVNDPDLDISPEGEDILGTDVDGKTFGPVKITVSRGADVVVLAYAGGDAASTVNRIDVGDDDASNARTLGPMIEIAPDAGIFELDFTIRYTDGPASTVCPVTTSFTAIDSSKVGELQRFDSASTTGEFCILQGDIITVEYTDATDASGDVNTVTDSATFDLRNGVLQSDKSVYIIGSDMILTIIEPDWDLDNDGAETYTIDIIEWDSDAATTTMGSQGINDGENAAAFDPEPTDFRETGDSTGIFQIVIEIPQSLSGDNLERGEEVVLEYTDWGPSGSDFVGQEDEDVNITVFTSNFGATVELDQKVYTWTDKVYITIVAPDHNFDSDLIDEIGESTADPIKVSTRGFNMDTYKLVETGTDTGIFTGEVILTGFLHDADGDLNTGDSDGRDTNPRTGDATGANKNSRGPTDGFLETDEDDGLTVSFEFSEDETVVGSALIRWNIGETQWLEASYPASGTGVVRIIDPDMNLNPEAVDNYSVDVWSDSDAGGIDLTVTETNEATGIFEGTVFFTTTNESSGHRLRVAEGDTVTAEYEDNTLPDPYTTADELDITATTLIGTIVPPLERAPAANLRTVDAFGNSLDTVSVDQQVQISADLANGQDREQAFAYLVQIQDGNGVTVSLAWITGALSAGQSFSPALSWIPTEAGTYTATAFVWESIDNPTALSPPVSTTIRVS